MRGSGVSDDFFEKKISQLVFEILNFLGVIMSKVPHAIPRN